MSGKYTEQEILHEINQIIDWFYESSTSTSNENLLEMEDRLSAFSFYLAEYIFESRKRLANAELTRKVMEAEHEVSLLKLDYSIAAASKKALLSTKKQKSREMDLYAVVHGLKPILDQANKVLDSLRTRISWNKEELKKEAYLQHKNENDEQS